MEDSITGGELRELAQEHFNTSFLKLVIADGGMVDPTQPVCPLGPDLTGIVIRPRVAATEGAFALYCPGSGVITWGKHAWMFIGFRKYLDGLHELHKSAKYSYKCFKLYL